MAKNYDGSIQKAFRLVENALQLDSNNRNKEAYGAYLESISFITSRLLIGHCDKVDAAGIGVTEIRKLVSAMRHCLDRIDALLDFLDDDISTSRSSVDNAQSSTIADIPRFCDSKMMDAENFFTSAAMQPTTAIPSTVSLKKSSSNILEALDWISPDQEQTDDEIEQQGCCLEKAKKDNAVLRKQYEMRIRAAVSLGIKANLRLELQRRMNDNWQMAERKQQRDIEKRKESKEYRLKKTKQFMATLRETSPPIMFSLINGIIDYEQNQIAFAKLWKKLDLCQTSDAALSRMTVLRILEDQNHPLTKEVHVFAQKTQNQMATLLEKVTLTEEDNSVNYNLETIQYDNYVKFSDSQESIDYEKQIRENLQTEEGTDIAAIESFDDMYEQNIEEINLVISHTKSRISSIKNELKNQKEFSSGDSLQTEVIKKQFTEIVKSVHAFMEQLASLFHIGYGKAFDGEVVKRSCVQQLEEHVYPVIWPVLIKLCKVVNKNEEDKVYESMRLLQNLTLYDLGYEALPRSSHNDFCPKAVQMLKQITELDLPTKKLEIFVKIVKFICDECCQITPNATKSLTADDLIPLLSFACIRSTLSQLVSEIYLLESLINPKDLMGEEGYCLTSFQTALQYIQTIDKPLKSSTA